MTNHRAGKTNTRDPRSWTAGKLYKRDTARLRRRLSREDVIAQLRILDEYADANPDPNPCLEID